MGIANKGWIDVSDDGVIGLKPLEKGIFMQPNTVYFIGASSSPDHIIVTDVGETLIKYYRYPYEKELRIERDVGEDLITRGSRRWMEQHKDHLEYPGFAKRYASLRELLSGKPSDELVSLNDYKMTEVEVGVDVSKCEFDNKTDFWRELEAYGSVGGINPPGYDPKLPIDKRLQRYLVRLNNGELKELKKDGRFKVIREVKT
jgi:hypothetical protein